MKKHLIYTLFICTLCSCSSERKADNLQGQINLLPALEQPVELKVSQLGKQIRYVPLETNDSSLIGNTYNIRLLEDKILINTNSRYLLFDKQTGKYLCSIGQKGQGPKDYSHSNAPCFVHPQNGNLHLIQVPNKLVVYNQEGQFLHSLKLPTSLLNNQYIHLTEEGGILYDGNILMKQDCDQLYFFNNQNEKTDSILLYTSPNMQITDVKDIKSMAVFTASKITLSTVGLLGYNGLYMMDLHDESRKLIPMYYPAFQQCGDKILFHNAFSDTIFQIKDKTLVPHLIFNMGEKHLSAEMQGKKNGTEELLTVTFVMETPKTVYFQLTEGIHHPGKEKLYDGIYNKENGKVIVGKRGALTDDLNRFMPFYIFTNSPQGEFAGMLEAPDILEWLEEHPDTTLDGNLTSLKELKEDDNPVCVIVEP